jgi:putative intracellular protease/amidase
LLFLASLVPPQTTEMEHTMHTHRILLVVTSSDRMGTAPEPTGFWLEEVAAPYYTFVDAKYDVTIASPKGGHAPVDPRSVDEASHTAATRRFECDSKAKHALAHTMKLSSVTLQGYDAVFFAGGHGTMDDFATDASVRATAEYFWNAGLPVAAVCHGPAALVQARTETGERLIKGRRFTCFTDAEEQQIGVHQHVPFLLESLLREQGGTPVNELPFQPNVVVDGPLVTGQNPPSSIPAAEALIHQLRQRAAHKKAA